MKYYLWLDDVRSHPYVNHEVFGVAHSVNEAIHLIKATERITPGVEYVLDLDHDLGDYAKDGGDGYKLVLWLIETGRNTKNYKVKCHSANPVGREHIMGLYERYWES